MSNRILLIFVLNLEKKKESSNKNQIIDLIHGGWVHLGPKFLYGQAECLMAGIVDSHLRMKVVPP